MTSAVSPTDLQPNSMNSQERKTYSKITFEGGDWVVCKPHDVAAMTTEEKGFSVADIQMTEAEFEALPEFNG